MSSVGHDDSLDATYLAELAAVNVRVQAPGDPPLFTATPSSPMRPVHWRWTDLEKIVSELDQHLNLSADGARRTLKLTNPGLEFGTTPTFWMSIQYIRPGEVATAHRHTPTAFRFVMQGHGCFTTVDGESYEMNEGDLVLTPSLMWHDHVHHGDEPMVWIDVLDISLVRSLHATFFELYKEEVQEPQPIPDTSFRMFGTGLLRAGPALPPSAVNPLLTYPRSDSIRALDYARGLPADPVDDVIVEHINPTNGSSALTTLSTKRQLLRPGFRGTTRRNLGSKVYWVVDGSGVTHVGDHRFEWSKGDFFAIPPWTDHCHENPYSAEASLFRVDDSPVYEKLGLYREETS